MMSQKEVDECLEALELLWRHGVLGQSGVRCAYILGLKQGEAKSDAQKATEAQARVLAGQR